MPIDIDSAAALVGLPISEKYREGVCQNVERAEAIARPLLELNLEDTDEPASRFEPRFK